MHLVMVCAIRLDVCAMCSVNKCTIAVEPSALWSVLCAVTGKRKRQENFQSRKRQAAAAPASTSNQAPAADFAQHPIVNVDSAVASSSQLNQPMQHSAAAALNATGASTPPSTAQSTMQTAHETSLMAPRAQLQPQLQDDASLGPVADAIRPAGVIAPLPGAQPEVQAVGVSHGQNAIPGLQESANGSSQPLQPAQRYVVSKPVNDARGHTGYLTFARRSVDD